MRDMAHFRNAASCIFNDRFSMGKVLTDICHMEAEGLVSSLQCDASG